MRGEEERRLLFKDGNGVGEEVKNKEEKIDKKISYGKK